MLLKLMRISVYPSLVSNVLTAWWLAGGRSSALLFSLLLTSSCFFLGGMVLNDFFDADIDARERPERPIPSGAVSKRTAGILGFFLIACALVGAGLIGDAWLGTRTAEFQFDSLALASLIILYNGGLKQIPVIGAVCMGLCRGGNILLIGIAVRFAFPGGPATLPLCYALGMIFYITVVTVISGFEGNEPGCRLNCKRIVGLALGLLIPIDAAVCLVFAGVLPALLILCLYPVALKLRKIVPMT